MVFKQSFKNLKNDKINLSKVILKLESLFYQNIYIFFIISYIHIAILTQTNEKKSLIEKKAHHLASFFLITSPFGGCNKN
jgi:hypothetical protein